MVDRITRTVSAPLKLPKAPKVYDERDQDHTRRLIELALGQYARVIQGVSSRIGAGSPFVDISTPVSPIHGMASSVGSGNAPGICQLKNPAGSGVFMVVYECQLGLDTTSSPNNQNGFRVTGAPLTLAGTVTTAYTERRDQRDATAIKGVLQAATDMAGSFNIFWPESDNQSFEYIPIVPTFNAAYVSRDMITPGQVPMVLAPGDAIEYHSGQASNLSRAYMYCVWDELTPAQLDANSVPVGVPLANVPYDLIHGSVRAFGAVNGPATIQLSNPQSSGKNIVLYGMRFNSNQGTSLAYAWSRVAQIAPPGAGATVTTGALRRFDRRSSDSITSQLLGISFVPTATGGQKVWTGFFATSQRHPQAMLQKKSFPIVIKPGSSIVIQPDPPTNGAGIEVVGYFLLDEITPDKMPF